jgi:hypothetical protein
MGDLITTFIDRRLEILSDEDYDDYVVMSLLVEDQIEKEYADNG